MIAGVLLRGTAQRRRGRPAPGGGRPRRPSPASGPRSGCSGRLLGSASTSHLCGAYSPAPQPPASRQARSALRSGKHRWSAQRSWWTYAGTEGSGEASGPEMSICTPKFKPLRRLHGHRHLQRAEHKESAPRSQDFSVAFRPSNRRLRASENFPPMLAPACGTVPPKRHTRVRVER